MKLKSLELNYDKKLSFFLGLFFAIIFLDRITKSLALNNYFSKINSKFLSFELMINRGISWGMFHSEDNKIFLLVSLIVLSIIILFFSHIKTKLFKQELVFAEILILAGAISNFIDRVFYSGVIDFIIFPFNLFVFNIADLSITIGVFLLLIELW